MTLICDKSSSYVLKQYLQHSTAFVNEFKWIADSYVSDFFLKNHWNHLQQTWQESLKDWSTEDLAFLLDRNKTTVRDCDHRGLASFDVLPSGFIHPTLKLPPLSLLSFKACTQTFSLDRHCASNFESSFHQLFAKEKNISEFAKGPTEKETILELSNIPDLHAFFKKHVKQKKRHEIQNLSKVIHLLGKASDCKRVIDIGSGLGHLSRLLSFRYGLKVISVEAASTHAPKASNFDREVEREIKKKKEKGQNSVLEYFQSDSSSLPCHVTRLIHPTTSIDEFMDVIKENQSSDQDNLNNSDKEHSVTVSPFHLNVFKRQKLEQESPLKGQVFFKGKKQDSVIEDDHTCNHTTDINVQSHPDDIEMKSSPIETKEGFESVQVESVDCNQSTQHCIETKDVHTEKFILTGLHACGDLTATFLRFFVNCPEAKGLASVGCCYMKLTDENTSGETMGYPLSECLTNTPNNQLSYSARELACHFADSYCQRLRDSPPHLRIHSYRAALEWLANQICPQFPRSSVQIPAKKANKLDFESYVKLGFQKLGLSYTEVTDSMMDTATQMTSRWKDVVSFYTVRLSLAPVIETIILLDRMLYLYEKGFESAVMPIFDPSLSPRNFVLLAWKR